MNETIMLDLSSVSFKASAACMNNGGMSDKCLFDKLCPVYTSHLTNYVIFLLCAIFFIFIVLIILNHTYYKHKTLEYYRLLIDVFFFYISAVIMYFIVFLYFTI